jgi:hypothetical protein
MASTMQDMVGGVLREQGSLSVDGLLGQVLARQSLVTKDPWQTVRNALANDPLCEGTPEGTYVYLPSFVRGACVRLGMERVAPQK